MEDKSGIAEINAEKSILDHHGNCASRRFKIR
jgi:hypothetical protein